MNAPDADHIRYERRYAAERFVSQSADVVFAFLDDHRNLSSHMEKSSLLMAGSRMVLVMDDAGGRKAGSRLVLSGRFLGIPLSVSESVIERRPPERKVWETDKEPRLLVIGRYRMGFMVRPAQAGSLVEVFLDYALPDGVFTRILGVIFGGLYARWCVRSVLNGIRNGKGAERSA